MAALHFVLLVLCTQWLPGGVSKMHQLYVLVPQSHAKQKKHPETTCSKEPFFIQPSESSETYRDLASDNFYQKRCIHRVSDSSLGGYID